MNKKGSHVDWAISMGIFLIYIIGMFILIRPGITPVHKPEGLLEMLEKNFIEDVMWEVKEVPLFIEKCNLEVLIPCTISIDDDNFKFSNFICKEGDCLGKENAVGSSVVCEGTEEKPNLGKGTVFETTYYLKEGVDKKAKPQLIMDYSNGNEDYCKAQLGASTSKEGINNDWLITLKTEKYNELKGEDRWKFPEGKEFIIYVADPSDSNILSENNKINGAEQIPQGVNVFSKEIKTNELTHSGILNPKIVIIQVW